MQDGVQLPRFSLMKNRTFVWKPITRYKKYDVLDCEVCILNHLSNFSWAPKLLWHNSSGLVTNYLSEPLSAYKIPLDYKEQLRKIVDDKVCWHQSHTAIFIKGVILNVIQRKKKTKIMMSWCKKKVAKRLQAFP